MAKIKYIMALACLWVGLVGCSEDNSLDEGASVPQQAIGFSTYFGRNVQTKAVSLNQWNINQIGVFAKVTNDGWKDGQAFPANSTFMDNLRLHRDWQSSTNNWGDWGYAPQKYWPKESGKVVNFFAYSAYRSNPEFSDDGGYPTIQYHFDQNEDIVYASALNQTVERVKNNSDGKVALSFKHAMARAQFEIAASVPLEENGAEIIVKEVKLYYSDNWGALINVGSLNLATGFWTKKEGDGTVRKNYTWTPTTDANSSDDFKFYPSTLKYQAPAYAGETAPKSTITNTNNSYLFVIPQSVGFHIRVSYTLKQGTFTEDLEAENDVNLNFEAGKAYRFNLVVGLDPVDFNVITDVMNWNE